MTEVTYTCERCNSVFHRRRNGKAYRFCSQNCSGLQGTALKNAQATECSRGHINWVFDSRGKRRYCRTCHVENNRKYRKLRKPWRYMDRSNNIRRTTERRAAKNSQFLTVAHNNRKWWTGPECELLTRNDLSDSECALLLGRSLRAVETMRYRLKTEPKMQQLAGIGKRVASRNEMESDA